MQTLNEKKWEIKKSNSKIRRWNKNEQWLWKPNEQQKRWNPTKHKPAEEINNENENTTKSLQEQIHSLNEDIEHYYRTNSNNKQNISERTVHNYQGKN